MGIRKWGGKWLVTAESGRDEFGVRRRVCRSVDTEDEAKGLDFLAEVILMDSPQRSLTKVGAVPGNGGSGLRPP